MNDKEFAEAVWNASNVIQVDGITHEYLELWLNDIKEGDEIEWVDEGGKTARVQKIG